VNRNWLRSHQRSGRINGTFTARSADAGYLFGVDVEGLWEERAKHPHHDPEAVAAAYVIEEVGRLACSLSLFEGAQLQDRSNRLLGKPVTLPHHTLRVIWATVHVRAEASDISDLVEMQRRRASAKRADDEMRIRIERITAFRDSLRDDPTLALAQMLLETPGAVSPETLDTMQSVAMYMASSAPGAEVAIAQLLKAFVEDMKPDAKQYIVERLCEVLVEFGGGDAANQISALSAQGLHLIPARPADPETNAAGRLPDS